MELPSDVFSYTTFEAHFSEPQLRLRLETAGIIRAEVLHGTRDPRHRAQLISALDSFRQENIPRALWDQVGDFLAALRAKGISVPFNDVAIAVLAIHIGVELWTRDQQFTLIQSVLPALRLFKPTP